MIHITKLAAAVLLQKDGTEIVIDDRAVKGTLGLVLACLIDCAQATQAARRSGYEDGLVQGRINATIEMETSERIAERQAADLVDVLVGVNMASAA